MMDDGKNITNDSEQDNTINTDLENIEEVSITESRDIDDNRDKRKKHSLRFKILIGCSCAILAIAIFLFSFGWHLLGYINRKDFSDTEVDYQEEEFGSDGEDQGYESADPDSIIWEKYGEIKEVEGIKNILLCAEENQYGAQRGRSDVIMIATIDTNTQSLKLMSILRDTYVPIPGFSDNRINSSYATGDIPLLEETIKENFNIQVDGYVKVDFDSFTKVIDELGGVEVTLTEEEATWLNESNHILDPDSRNVTAGTHILNGSQALGYSRIRYIPTADGIGSDFGRVWRQKHVLMQVFNKYKNLGLLDILDKAPDILSLVQTDYSRMEVFSLIKTVMGLDTQEIETLSIPVRKGYTPKKIRGDDVLVPDLKINNEAISEFIYGTNSTDTTSNNKEN